jgi:hypothetical protein
VHRQDGGRYLGGLAAEDAEVFGEERERGGAAEDAEDAEVLGANGMVCASCWLLRLLRRSMAHDLYYLKRAIEHGEIAKR